MADKEDKKEKGNPIGDAKFLLGIFVVLFFVWLVTGGPARARFTKPFVNSPVSSEVSSGQTEVTNVQNKKTWRDIFSFPKFPTVPSPKVVKKQPRNEGSVESEEEIKVPPTLVDSLYKGKISLSSGTAFSQIVPNREYIIITAKSGNKEPINISGWSLKNGRSEKNYNISGEEVAGQSITVKLPTSGVKFYNPYRPTLNAREPLILKPGERVILITGSIPSIAPVQLKEDSFRVNKCFGYIVKQTNYKFYPSFSTSCPKDADIAGVSQLSDSCYDYIRRRPSCRTPELKYVKDDGYCYDGNCNLNQFCQAFIVKNYSYQSCFDRHLNDEDFFTRDWRVYLGRTWELWDNRRESITLFDGSGKLVTKIEKK